MLTSRVLCKSCNDALGKSFEAKARFAPELRKAVATHRKDLPADFLDSLEIGTEYISDYGGLSARQRVRKDGSLSVVRLDDGSIIVPEGETPAKLTEIMRGHGSDPTEIAEALRNWETAPPDEIRDIGGGRVVRKWEDHAAQPSYTEAPINPLVLVKIAFEFVALLVGGSIYATHSGIDATRQALRTNDEAFARSAVAIRVARQSEPLHGIAFMGNDPEARFRVRLFGTLDYHVAIPSLKIAHPRFVYTHLLRTGEEVAQELTVQDGSRAGGAT